MAIKTGAQSAPAQLPAVHVADHFLSEDARYNCCKISGNLLPKPATKS